MRRKCILALLLIVVGMSVSGCANTASEDMASNVSPIAVQSDSIDEAGKLLTETAADMSINDPIGSNQSPHLSWDAVDGAAYYAVCMFDTSAQWLHWLIGDLEKTELEQGEYTSRDDYIGPYPPKGSNPHQYRIEIFALRQAVNDIDLSLNAKHAYADIEAYLDLSHSGGDNILARGSITGKYGN